MSDQQAAPQIIVSPTTVLVHGHDGASGLYQLVIGQKIIQSEWMEEVPVLDENGQPQYDEDPTTGVLVLRTTAEERPAETLETINTEDFVFADDDPQWFDEAGNRLDPGIIASRQKELVRAALDQRAADAAAATTPIPPTELPGVGEEL